MIPEKDHLNGQDFDFRDSPTLVESLQEIVQISSGHHSAALTKDGTLYFWGTGVFGSFFEPQLIVDLDIVDVSIGGCFGAAVDREGMVWTWGSNTNGELGLGDFEQRPFPHPVAHLKNKPVSKIACGGAFAIALGKTKDGHLNSKKVVKLTSIQ
jgi:X-linked retinitis pigmentosa GTPase regulator